MRSIPSFAVIAVLVTSCTSVLGIDDKYVLESDEPANTGGVFNGTGGVPSSGGAPPVSGSGGTTVSDASVPETGPADSSTGCRPGHVEGTFDGVHNVVVVPGSVTNGLLSFDLRGTGGTLTVESGQMSAGLTAVTITGANLVAEFSGELDCGKGTLSGHLTGQVKLLNAIPTPITGTWEGKVDASGSLSGTWTESELATPGVPDAGGGSGRGVCVVGSGLPPSGVGCGTWTAQ